MFEKIVGKALRSIGCLLLVSLAGVACGSDGDGVAVPTSGSETVVEAVNSMAEMVLGDLVDVAVSAGEFPTLIAAVEAAGLLDTLKSEGPFTVFAPTEEAFAAALEALGLTAGELLADVEMLTAVLTYHVVPGRVMAGDLTGAMAMPVATVNGAEISITEAAGSVTVNEATVVVADIEASNGVIHVIDQVLLPPADEPGDLVDVAVSAGEFPTLIAAVEAAGLLDTLKSEGPFTVFAPTEEAFAAALEALGLTAGELLADVEMLTAVLTYHVVPGRVMAGDLTGAMAMPVATVNGAEISITEAAGSVTVNEATVVVADIEASNGVIHVIDQVLLPPADEPGDLVDVAVSAGEFPTLIAAVEAAGLLDTLKSEGPFTVFAPTEEAFAAALEALGLTAGELLADVEMLTAVLTYHVVPGRVMAGDLTGAMAMPVATVNGAEISITEAAGSVTVNEATVVVADIEASNGVIHVIDQVLLPPADEPGDLVDVAVSAGEFPTLIAAVEAAGLLDTLKSEGPFTVFAPTEEAFAAALEALGLTAGELLADVEMLTAVLTYHVVPGRVMAGDLTGAMAMPVATVNGAEISITEAAGSVTVNEATVVVADIEASNGVIHVIDQVLLPPADEPGDLVDVAVSAGEFPTLIAAVEAAGLLDTLKSEGPFTVFAPTEEAFAAALEALGLTAGELLADVEMLTAVLTYHVVPGRVMAGDLTGAMAMPVATIHICHHHPAHPGPEISITEAAGSVTVNEATVVFADIEASNGVIHVIDQVLLPY